MGVPPTAGKSDIAKAYKKLAARYHPDLHQGNELKDLAREKMDQLNRAYEVLSDEAKRAVYDRERLSNPVYRQTKARTPKVLPRLLLLVVLVFVAYLALRIFPNPRVSTIMAVVVALVWFGPRIFRFFFGKKS